MKLSITVDMGAKNNGVFIAKSDKNNIIEKKATTIVIDKNSINFSKKSRRENRHRVRNYTRRKLAKRLFWEFLDKNNFDLKQQELIQGLLNNRGYTFLSIDSEFDELSSDSVNFVNSYFDDLKECKTKDDFLKILDNYDSDDQVVIFCDNITKLLDTEYKKKKDEIDKNFKDNWGQIKKDIKNIRDLYIDIKKEIQTGSKPRKKYLLEIKDEIEGFDFIDTKEDFYNLVANISNLQLRILRKFFNDNKDRYTKLKKYFLAFHYKTDEEKQRRKELFKEISKYDNIENFLKNTNPELTIPPYEDMNNRNTYKCNSILIRQDAINESLKSAIDILKEQDDFKSLKLDNLSYPQKLQRIVDINSKIIDEKIHPRNIFKHKKGDYTFYKNLLAQDYESFKQFAQKYYKVEELALNGIFKEDSEFYICKTNTPYKNNIKHILLKPLYSYSFTEDEASKFLDNIKNTYGLKSYLEKISKSAKEYQNSFYSVVKSCHEDKKCIADKEIKSIVTNLDKRLKDIQGILNELKIDSNLKDIELSSDNITKILNIFKQTYELLFKDINGFSKTCKSCSIENSIRSDENNPIAKRLLSDVAKPIDGMLDMLLDRLAFEITEKIDNIDDIDEVEILLEQNRFEFEENLSEIKGKKSKRENKDALNSEYCAYTGALLIKDGVYKKTKNEEKKGYKIGDWDHIIPQSKEILNSTANLIYVSSQANRNIKKNNKFSFEQLNSNHLKDIFGTSDKKKIKNFIEKYIKDIDTKITQKYLSKYETSKMVKYKNFYALNLNQQKAFRYALFLDENDISYKIAYDLLKQDKLKNITNGTQKRLARLIQEKLNQKFNKTLDIKARVLDNKLVSATRKELAVDSITGEINHLWKEEKQDSHSHCIDAMVVFYLANSKIKNQNSYKETTLEPIYSFDDIFLAKDKLNIKNLSKRKTFIETNNIKSYQLFDDTIYSENYNNIYYENGKLVYYKEISEKDFNKIKSKSNKLKIEKHNLFLSKKEISLNDIKILFEEKNILYVNKKYKKYYIYSKKDLDDVFKNYDKNWKKVVKIDILNLSNFIYNLFINEKIDALEKIKFLDDLRYVTSRKPIEDIFYNQKNNTTKNNKIITKLKEFKDIKNIPLENYDLYKSIYKKLKNSKLFEVEDGKTKFNLEKFYKTLKELYSLPDKHSNKLLRKRGKKRHVYSLPILGSAKFRIKRDKIWQISSNKNIATKWYIITNGNKTDLIDIPCISKNVIPLEIKELIKYLTYKDQLTYNIVNIKDINIDDNELKKYIKILDYKLTEAGRLTLITTLYINKFKDIDFSNIEPLKYKNSKEFAKFVDNYLNKKIPKGKEEFKYILELKKYIGGIRNDNKDAKAILINVNQETITLQYKASMSKDKKEIILKNIK